MNFIIIIPARLYSSRFPEKLLANICGKPMIIRVIEKALTTKANKIIVAVDDIKLKKIIISEYHHTQHSVEVCLTKSIHRSGTERLAEAIKNYRFSEHQIIVQLQGDEPLISSNMIHQLVKIIQTKSNDISVATLATPIHSNQEADNHNIVKVIVNINNHALYFSRSKIPWSNLNNNLDIKNKLLLRHIGIYAYRANFLKSYIKWDQSPLEQIEMLEQLRVLWNDKKIYVSIIEHSSNISVDTPESLKQVNKLFLNK